MNGIDEHHARDLLAISRSEHTKVECAEVVPNKHVRFGNRSASEEAVQLVGDIPAGARLIGRVAPTETGAIVRTNTGKSTDLWLNQLPDNGGVIWTGLHDDGRTPRARTVDVKPQPTDVHEFAGGRIAMAFPLRHRKLKYCTRSNDHSHGHDEPFRHAPEAQSASTDDRCGSRRVLSHQDMTHRANVG